MRAGADMSQAQAQALEEQRILDQLAHGPLTFRQVCTIALPNVNMRAVDNALKRLSRKDRVRAVRTAGAASRWQLVEVAGEG